jgi:hypothetical protein
MKEVKLVLMNFWDWGMAQVAECLPMNNKPLSSNPSITKKKKKTIFLNPLYPKYYPSM